MDDDLRQKAKQNIKDYWQPTSGDSAISNAWEKAKSMLGASNSSDDSTDATKIAMQKRIAALQGQSQ